MTRWQKLQPRMAAKSIASTRTAIPPTGVMDSARVHPSPEASACCCARNARSNGTKIAVMNDNPNERRKRSESYNAAWDAYSSGWMRKRFGLQCVRNNAPHIDIGGSDEDCARKKRCQNAYRRRCGCHHAHSEEVGDIASIVKCYGRISPSSGIALLSFYFYASGSLGITLIKFAFTSHLRPKSWFHQVLSYIPSSFPPN